MCEHYYMSIFKLTKCIATERQPSSTMWQNCSDRSKAFLQSWQASGSTAPTTDGVGGTTASEPFQRAAEIVAAAATEAAAAAASVVVSAASKRIKEHLESMYSSASGPDSFGNLSALPGLLVRFLDYLNTCCQVHHICAACSPVLMPYLFRAFMPCTQLQVCPTLCTTMIRSSVLPTS